MFWLSTPSTTSEIISVMWTTTQPSRTMPLQRLVVECDHYQTQICILYSEMLLCNHRYILSDRVEILTTGQWWQPRLKSWGDQGLGPNTGALEVGLGVSAGGGRPLPLGVRIPPAIFLKTQMLNPVFWWLLRSWAPEDVYIRAKLGHQYIVGPQLKSWGTSLPRSLRLLRLCCHCPSLLLFSIRNAKGTFLLNPSHHKSRPFHQTAFTDSGLLNVFLFSFPR